MSRMKWYIALPLKLALFLVLCVLSTYVSFLVLSKGISVEVPDLDGKSLKEVEMIITEKGLLLRIDGEKYDRNIPAGHVLEQDLPPGSHVRGQAEVKVVLSKGTDWLASKESGPSVNGKLESPDNRLTNDKGEVNADNDDELDDEDGSLSTAAAA